MKKYNAVIFDLDGVICHTDKYHYQAWKAVADEQEYYLLNQFCTMIHNLDMKICIEGVENAQEWLKIRKLRPEFTQGYFWGKPCGYEEFMRKFIERK